MKEEAKWDLLDRIQENTEGWENDKGRKSGINYDYECIKSFMGTDDFHNVSAVYGLDSQILANCFKAFASYLDIPKKEWNKYHVPYEDIDVVIQLANRETISPIGIVSEGFVA